MTNCKKCQTDFEIREEDKEFYKNFNTPDPTLCPQCREQRRLAFRNETSLYAAKCDMCGKRVITSYAPETPFPKYCSDCFYGDKWDAKKYARDFDFDRPFFEQFKELRDQVPRLCILTLNCVNCDYTSYTGDCKNCYLVSAGEQSEDCYYSKLCQNNTNIVDSDFIWDSELCYGCINVSKCYHCFSSYQLENCNDCYFSFDLKGCKNCLFSYNLRNKEYCIFNEKYSKEEFDKKLSELKLHTYSGYQNAISKWIDLIKNKAIHKGSNLINCENVTGDNLKNCRNMHICFDMQNSEDCAYCAEGDAITTYDANNLYYKPELNYEVLSNLAINRVSFSMFIYYCNNVQYSDICYNSDNLFGCVGMQREKYCIMNKQFGEEEYKEMVNKIVEHMKKTGEYGEFFPHELSPYGYNESLAYEYYPISKEVSLKNGWNWRDKDEKISDIEKSIKSSEIPDDINDVSDEITKCAIVCEQSGKPFKIIPQELSFYRRFKLPIPRKHPFERHIERLNLRNPRQLWKRRCVKCNEEFSSTYAPDRPEKVYCEKCYLETVV